MTNAPLQKRINQAGITAKAKQFVYLNTKGVLAAKLGIQTATLTRRLEGKSEWKPPEVEIINKLSK